jgi:glycosyltransferase involved in cell wall biosynthesis
MSDPQVTVVLPCYNERELALEHTLQLYEVLKKKSWTFELLVCDDASTDGTGKMLDALTQPEIKAIHYTRGPSRRENLAVTLSKGRGQILVFMDMDLATDLSYLDSIIDPVMQGKYDLAIGSRYQKGADVKRELIRLVYSIGYNTTIRVMFGSKILDHQCGFKAFQRQVLQDLVKEMGYDEKFLRGWFWDAELLIRAQRKKLRILETPVRWVSGRKSSFNFVRELKVLPYMFDLKRRLSKESRISKSQDYSM